MSVAKWNSTFDSVNELGAISRSLILGVYSDFSVKSAFCRTCFLVATEENQRRCTANTPLDWKYTFSLVVPKRERIVRYLL